MEKVITVTPGGTKFRRGDANDSGPPVDISDPVYTLNFLFLGGPGPKPPNPNEPCALEPVDSPTFLGCDSFTHCN